MFTSVISDSLFTTSLSYPAFITLLILIGVLLYIHTIRSLRPPLPPSIPWVGVNPNQYFSKFRAHRREWSQAISFLSDGYSRYNKHGRPFATPNCTFEPEVLIPPEHLPWLISQGEATLSPFPTRDTIMGLRYIAPSVVCSDRALHDAVLLGPLTRGLGGFTARNAAVIAEALPKLWANGAAAENGAEGNGGKGWRGINTFDTLQQLITEMTAVSFFGADLGRDERFRSALTRHGTLVALNAGISRLFAPPPLRPFVAPLLALPTNINEWFLGRWLMPVIKHKLEQEKDRRERGRDVEAGDKTLLDFLVESSMASPDARNRDPRVILSRMLLIVFAAQNTTLIAMVWVLVHLQSSPDQEKLMAKLREEAEAALALEPTGLWTRAKLADLKVHDSVIRETLRHTGFGGRSVMHQVISKQGVQLPSGEKLPEGSWVGVDIRDIHRDERYYDTPEAWSGLRFVDVKSESTEPGEEKDHQDGLIAKDTQTILERKKQSLVTTSNTFLAFSHGRHACPGRFFAAHQLKLLLAHIVSQFDIKSVPKKVEIKFVTDFVIPPVDELVWIKPRGAA